jgi:histone deacetylase 11
LCSYFFLIVSRTVHSEQYLESLKKSSEIARITEFSFVNYLPHFVVKNRVLNPMLYGTSGSILAGKVAMERGWAINLSGGFHHCSAHQGGGYCFFAVL